MATDDKKFYKTVFTVTVLSDKPMSHREIRDVVDEIETGDCSGEVDVVLADEISKYQMAVELQQQQSDPEFLLGEGCWRYALHAGDEVQINTGDNEVGPSVIIKEIEYHEPEGAEDYVKIVTDKGERIEALVKELS